MVEQANKTRIDQARSELRRALVEMAKAGRHGEGSALQRGSDAPSSPASTTNGRSGSDGG